MQQQQTKIEKVFGKGRGATFHVGRNVVTMNQKALKRLNWKDGQLILVFKGSDGEFYVAVSDSVGYPLTVWIPKGRKSYQAQFGASKIRKVMDQGSHVLKEKITTAEGIDAFRLEKVEKI